MTAFTVTYADGTTERVDARNLYEAANLVRQLRPGRVAISLSRVEG
jgi:hypothetical protein